MLSIHPTDHTGAAIIAIFTSLIGRFGQAVIGPDPQEWKRLVNGPSLEYNQRRHRSSGGRPWTEASIEACCRLASCCPGCQALRRGPEGDSLRLTCGALPCH